jgi:hypothetical protein
MTTERTSDEVRTSGPDHRRGLRPVGRDHPTGASAVNAGTATAMLVLGAILFFGKAKVSMITVPVAGFFLLLGSTWVGQELERWLGLGASWAVGMLQ